MEKVVRSFSIKSNDFMMTTYICSLIRAIMSLHKLINNKIQNKLEIQKLREMEKKEKEEKEEKEKKKEEEAKKEKEKEKKE